jgi:hypothetical protein
MMDRASFSFGLGVTQAIVHAKQDAVDLKACKPYQVLGRI